MQSQQLFRVFFLIGMILLFISVFLDFYYYQVSKDGELIALYSYNFFSEWTTHPEANDLTKILKPEPLEVSIVIVFIFLGAIFFSIYGMLMIPIERQENMEKIHKFAYCNVFVVVLSSFFILIFPIEYLIPNELYFPFLQIEYQGGFDYIYSIGPGYVLQLMGFILIFPYTLFNFHVISKFKMEAREPEKVLNTIISSHQASIDYDKMIAEEQLSLRFDEHSKKMPLIKKRRIPHELA